MSIGPLASLPASLAGQALAQAHGSEMERAGQETVAQQLRTAGEQKAETAAVLRNSWQPVGRIDQAARPGDFFAGTFLGQPYVVVRDGNGALGAFHNVCAHHAAQVACGQGHADELVCPYHGWTYALDGR